MLLTTLRVHRRRARAHETRPARLGRRDALAVPAARARRVPAHIRARMTRRDGVDGLCGVRERWRERGLRRLLALAVH